MNYFHEWDEYPDVHTPCNCCGDIECSGCEEDCEYCNGEGCIECHDDIYDPVVEYEQAELKAIKDRY